MTHKLDIIKILNGTDDTWKYWCVSVFGLNTIKPIDPRLMTEFNRIAANPTKNEVLEEVHELIMELMETNGISQLLVEENGNYAGVVHLHDLIKEGII